MEEAREHPTGRYWDHNFLKPTVLSHSCGDRGQVALPAAMFGADVAFLLTAGQFHYVRYISWHLLDMRYLLPPKAKADLLAGAHVCRHCEGCWNSISDDQFGEQTAIKTGKGALKGITLSPELVTERIDSFPISVYVSDAMGHMYSRLINYPTLRHRPNTKRKVMSDGSLNLTTGRPFRQNLQNIPTH